MDDSEAAIELIVFVILAVPWALMIAWIYGDAERWSEDRLKWVVLTTILGVFAVLYYLSVRKEGKVLCQCGRYYSLPTANCPHCGRDRVL